MKKFLSPSLRESLCCPVCKEKIIFEGDTYFCTNVECSSKYPVVNGIPILINESNSIFSKNEFIKQEVHSCQKSKIHKIKKYIKRLVPSISKNLKAKQNFNEFKQKLYEFSSKPKVLVIGGGTLGEGIEELIDCKNNLEIVETDVVFGPRTRIIVDAHDIPFINNTFDGVVIQAVLEHVVDPFMCVEEIFRILKKQGIVYSETPFMQQVHMGCHDFTRFTNLGHRRLFRKFEEIDSGIICGPGMALAWAYEYFLLSFTTSKLLRKLIRVFARFTSFYLPYFDLILAKNPAAYDAASGFFFLGRKGENILSDRDLIKNYKGGIE